MTSLGVGGTPDADGWTYVTEVASAVAQGTLETAIPGDFEVQVRTFDGEFWSPWSTETASVTVPATIRAPTATGSAATTLPTTRSQGPDSPAAQGSANATVPLYSVQHILNAPSISGSAGVGFVEQLWTWIENPVSSSTPEAVLSTAGWPVGHYEWQVRTFDGEFWSPWSSEIAAYTIPATVAAPTAVAIAAVADPVLRAVGPDVPAIAGAMGATVPSYSVEHVLNAPSMTGSAHFVAVEPIWTWLSEVISADQNGPLDTSGFAVEGYEVEVRTFDGEFWGPWSTPVGFTVHAPYIYFRLNNEWRATKTNLRINGEWKRYKPQKLGS